jgi:hypothetical protein
MPHVTFLPLVGFRIREQELLELGMPLPCRLSKMAHDTSVLRRHRPTYVQNTHLRVR